jgi:hypothetical protein
VRPHVQQELFTVFGYHDFTGMRVRGVTFFRFSQTSASHRRDDVIVSDVEPFVVATQFAHRCSPRYIHLRSVPPPLAPQA